jgi:hypothetical protein
MSKQVVVDPENEDTQQQKEPVKLRRRALAR